MTHESYARHRDQAAGRQAEQSRQGREIGPLPEVADPERKEAARLDFGAFLEDYLAAHFELEWSDEHIHLIRTVERVVLHGELYCLAWPRGFGKSAICRAAVLWSVLYGHHQYAFLIAATEAKAKDELAKITAEIEDNDTLLEDFPEVCYPIRRLERINNRARGQTLDGVPTRIDWSKTRIALPTVAGSPASGAVIGVAGLTGGEIRGSSYRHPATGSTLRPSLVVCDDPQTRSSAKSPLQSKERETLVSADVLGMAGPRKPIAVLMPVTVIHRGDMADRMLDRELHPEWHGDRHALLKAWPQRMDLWEEYARIRADELKSDGDGSRARDFYRNHRDQMDAGAEVAWEEFRTEQDVSALECALRLFFRNEDGFHSEYQNDPQDLATGDEDLLTVEEICKKITPFLERGRTPQEANHVVAYIDVQEKCLYYVVSAWSDDATGWVIDYGSYPDQKRPYYTLATVKRTLRRVHTKTGREGSIYAGLRALTEDLFARPWTRADDVEMPLELCLIDAAWGETTPAIKKFCRESAHRGRVLPSFGRAVGASSIPMQDLQKKAGERVGHYWRMRVDPRERSKYILLDTNYWKSWLNARLSTEAGDPGALCLFEARPATHRMFAEHLRAEYPVRTEAGGRVVTEWKHFPEKPDNHLLDCATGSCVAASIQGVELGATAGRKREKVSLSQAREAKRNTPSRGGGSRAKLSEMRKAKSGR